MYHNVVSLGAAAVLLPPANVSQSRDQAGSRQIWNQREFTTVRIGYDGDGSNNERLAKRKRGPYKGASTAMISLKVAMRCGDTLLFCCQRMNEHRDNSLITSFGHRTSVPLQFAFLNRSGSDDFLLAPSAAHRLIKQKAT
ncbi:unnamed protein product [Sphagnum jensenii]|uniref:Secreted protein n=1 Tax=Sphagnum jensenii TaxID=128206 RepID=A0ABP0VM96_9BRYO